MATRCPPVGYASTSLIGSPSSSDASAGTTHTAKWANHLLSALPADEMQLISECLEPVRFGQGHVIHESGERLNYAYFPTTVIVSLLFPLANGSAPEVAVVGNEGLVGVSVAMDTDSTPCQAVAQSAGAALRIRATDLRRLFDETNSLRSLLMRYTQVLFTQASQSAVCNGRHTIEQALCRWLLTKQDRAPSDEIQVTHEWVASLMGVRREGVSIAAERLHAAGVIKCGRGKITIVDRNALEARSCECYRIVRDEYARLLK